MRTPDSKGIPLTKRDGRLARKYLLGDLGEAERTKVEERFFEQTEFSELLSEAEYDLIDEYVRDHLSRYDRERFEKCFLISERRRESLNVAKTLFHLEALPSERKVRGTGSTFPGQRWLVPLKPHRLVRSYAFATAVLLLLSIGAWLFVEKSRLRSEIAQLPAAINSSQPHQASEENRQLEPGISQVEQKAAPARRPNSSRTTLLTVLSPGYRDDRGPTELAIPRATRMVRLQLNLNAGDEYFRYDVELQRVNGELIRRWQRLTSRRDRAQRIVLVEVPAAWIKPGQYELALKGKSGRYR